MIIIIRGDIILSEAAMAMRSFGFVLPLMLLLALAGAQNTNILWHYCNDLKFQVSDPFFSTSQTLFTELEDNTGDNGGFYETSIPGSPTAYGQATCNSALAPDECQNCLYHLVWLDMIAICGFAIGAQCALVDCYIRYEQYQFY